MKSLVALVGLCALVSSAVGCGADCLPSADIQVTVVATSGVDPQAIAKLRVRMSVDGAPMKELDIRLTRQLSSNTTTLILRPDTTPTGPYSVALSVTALDDSGGELALGTGGGDMVPNGCNRIETRLLALDGGSTDGGAPAADLSASDGPLTPPSDQNGPDLARCMDPNDEDQDGRGNACDACPADSDPQPTDADSDGLSDACDPDPILIGNKLVYFEPFNGTAPHWSGTFKFDSGGFINIDTGSTNGSALQTLWASNTLDDLPVGVRVQTYVLTRGFYVRFQSDPVQGDMGIFLGQLDSQNQPENGMICTINRNSRDGDTLDLNPVQGGNVRDPISQPFSLAVQTQYRLRLTQRGKIYTCEAMAPNQPATIVTATVDSTPAAPQRVALRANSTEAHFYSVVAESALP